MAKEAVKAKKAEPAKQASAALAYKAPALEKGLDILELLAAQSGGLILSQIAHSLGRSVQEVYRVVVSLERRGYVERKPPGEAFQISMKLFDLACGHPPIRRLRETAQPILQSLAAEVEEAIILSILDGLSVRVIAVADNPAPVGFRVRLGTQTKMLSTASGRTLIAFQNEPTRAMLIERASEELRARDRDPEPLIRRVEQIQKRGYEVVADETLRGITDVSFPIFDASGIAQAALTMPFLLWVTNQVQLADASKHLYEAAAELCRQIGGYLPEPKFPIRGI
ncbi:IclR family transcriptional regulator [Kaistia defluvii]|uniref:DNA-binding IclR family transcriptional regulator n=1 Tax=Kaistia defluvii TaxID=410841 RepID=A0ABV2R171_9HYPH